MWICRCRSGVCFFFLFYNMALCYIYNPSLHFHVNARVKEKIHPSVFEYRETHKYDTFNAFQKVYCDRMSEFILLVRTLFLDGPCPLLLTQLVTSSFSQTDL